MKAGLQVKQDGTKINGTCDTDHMGSLALDRHRGWQEDLVHASRFRSGQKITFSGTVDGNKMSGTTDPEGGEWTATRI